MQHINHLFAVRYKQKFNYLVLTVHWERFWYCGYHCYAPAVMNWWCKIISEIPRHSVAFCLIISD